MRHLNNKQIPKTTPENRYVHLPTVIAGAGISAVLAIALAQPPTHEPTFMKSHMSDHQVYVNTQNIRWFEHNPTEKCFYLCTDDRGCFKSQKIDDKYKVCEYDSPSSYKTLQQYLDFKK